MKSIKTTDGTDLVVVGRVAKAQGRFGEIAVDALTDSPDRFARLRSVFVEGERGEPVEYRVASVRSHKGRPVLKLDGIDEIGSAQALSGKEIQVPESAVLPLPEGSYYHFQLLGATVSDRSLGLVGVVAEVLSTGGTDILVVKAAAGGEALIPLCSEICRRIDPDEKQIEVEAPGGLMELNAN